MRNLILSALLFASALQTAMGQTYTFGDYEYTRSNNQAHIHRYTGSGGAVTIPSTINSYPVGSIGDYAFASCISLTSVTIPNSVTSIGMGAFANCPNLASVSIPNSVTSIGSDAFSNCPSLASVSIPNSVTSIGSDAFSNSALGSVFLSPNLSSSQITQAGFPSTAVFYVGSVGAPTSMANQADLATTQAELASTKAELAVIKAQLETLPVALTDSLAFVNAVANKIKGQEGNFGIATQSGLSTAIEPLATKTQITTAINEGKASGIASVTASPNTWSLFTTSQIQNMAVGDLVLTRTNGSNLVLNYDIEQSEDLQTWTTYQAYALPLTNLPTNKAFIRIKAKQ
jgi:BspA type Leucine rich repeat region (6 copies)